MQVLSTPKELSEYLKKHGVKPSLIRLKVMQYLMGTREHPNVDVIYRHISREIPTLSKTSIYNTLKVFRKTGVVREIMIEENEIRYDAFTARHAHFKCVSCGGLQDIDLGCGSCSAGDKLGGGRVTEEQIYLKGYCAACVKKEEEKTAARKTKPVN